MLKKLDFPYSEILVTFLTFLKNLMIEFKKEMHTQYIRIEPTIYLDNSMDDNIILTNMGKIFETILLNSLNTIITDETNIYQSALKKYQLLLLE